MTDYVSLINDLRERARHLNELADQLEALPWNKPATPEPVRRVSTPRHPAIIEASPAAAPRETETSLSELIRTVVAEAPRTSIEIADRVQQIRKQANRERISAIISQHVQAGKFHKGEDLKLRLVQNGRVKLPPSGDSTSLSASPLSAFA